MKKAFDALHMDARDLFRQVVHVFQVVDRLHLVLQGLYASGFDRRLIHPAGVEIAHLLHVGAGRFFGGGFLGDFFQRVVVLLDQLIEANPSAKTPAEPDCSSTNLPLA